MGEGPGQPILTVADALNSLEHAQARGNFMVDLEVRKANLHAAVAKASADAMQDATERLVRAIAASIEAQERTRQTTIDATNILRESVDSLTSASNANTEEMSKWAKSTARWTKWLTWATVALFASAVVQVFVMWFSLFKL